MGEHMNVRTSRFILGCVAAEAAVVIALLASGCGSDNSTADDVADSGGGTDSTVANDTGGGGSDGGGGGNDGGGGADTGGGNTDSGNNGNTEGGSPTDSGLQDVAPFTYTYYKSGTGGCPAPAHTPGTAEAGVACSMNADECVAVCCPCPGDAGKGFEGHVCQTNCADMSTTCALIQASAPQVCP
jgi:hypothetical protein